MQGDLELHNEFEASLRHPGSKHNVIFKERKRFRLGMGDGAGKVAQA